MDNNMTAIVSVIMIVLGFANGMIVSQLFALSEIGKFNKKISDAADVASELQDKIDFLEEELEYERDQRKMLTIRMYDLANDYTPIPPPKRPLTRSEPVACACESDNEEFVNPASPDAVQHSTE